MTEKYDITRRIVERSAHPMDDVETHKMGKNQSTGGNDSYGYGNKTDFIDDIGAIAAHKLLMPSRVRKQNPIKRMKRPAFSDPTRRKKQIRLVALPKQSKRRNSIT
ncbi:hypothetical protein [Nitrincola nitratireducens]|uniref:Uncharacterized protein n=1 Tax=Nitrincola nitratireducens TaxID=1229521 RepID=W9UPS9_9GAMM|nr:hypothetical protein [Nitrincola nitratireducens]EXJ09114.1 hypothetical protein D791_03944 [Nitrincola nitratireducens]